VVRRREIEQRLNPSSLKSETTELLSPNDSNPVPSQSALDLQSPKVVEQTNGMSKPEPCLSSSPSKTPHIRCAPIKRIIYHKRKRSGI